MTKCNRELARHWSPKLSHLLFLFDVLPPHLCPGQLSCHLKSQEEGQGLLGFSMTLIEFCYKNSIINSGQLLLKYMVPYFRDFVGSVDWPGHSVILSCQTANFQADIWTSLALVRNRLNLPHEEWSRYFKYITSSRAEASKFKVLRLRFLE